MSLGYSPHSRRAGNSPFFHRTCIIREGSETAIRSPDQPCRARRYVSCQHFHRGRAVTFDVGRREPPLEGPSSRRPRHGRPDCRLTGSCALPTRASRRRGRAPRRGTRSRAAPGRVMMNCSGADATCHHTPLALSHLPLRRVPPTAINVHGHIHAGEAPSRHHFKRVRRAHRLHAGGPELGARTRAAPERLKRDRRGQVGWTEGDMSPADCSRLWRGRGAVRIRIFGLRNKNMKRVIPALDIEKLTEGVPRGQWVAIASSRDPESRDGSRCW